MILSSSGLDRRDIVALGAASPVFYPHTVSYMEVNIRSAAAPWAGAELALTGTYLTDLPPPFEADGLAARSVTISKKYNDSLIEL